MKEEIRADSRGDVLISDPQVTDVNSLIINDLRNITQMNHHHVQDSS